ncbi:MULTISPECIES: hypothetical protein [unclassified Roseovarius]|uniref:hypothetical protein n=1 Tax=unclassified Roseovarius TaxID=2614913 RepID=UPI00273D991C|nr:MULTISPECIES: hypothetical protein [unclassified Roseovarius]
MKVIQEDTAFSASLITGPTHNFLSIRFGLGIVEQLIFTVTGSEKQGRNNRSIVEDALAAHSSQVPIRNKYYPREVIFRNDDTPSLAHYYRIVWKIFEAANTGL